MSSSASTAARGRAHHAPGPSAPNRTAPVEPEASAAVRVEERNTAPERGTAAIGAGAARREPGADLPGSGARESGAEARVVLHVDIDAFFAAIEQQRNP